MTTERTVRVTRTWDVVVAAEYGDTRESLCAKVTEEQLDELTPDAENRVVIEEHQSEYAKWHERPDAAVTRAALVAKGDLGAALAARAGGEG